MLGGYQVFLIIICYLIVSVFLIVLGKDKIGEKFTRKLIHISNGLAAASTYILIKPSDYWWVCIIAVVATGLLIWIRLYSKKNEKLRRTIYTTSKYESLGEVWFPVTFIFLVPVSRLDYLTFLLPVLILTLSDAAAALIGANVKSPLLSQEAEGKKSMAGTISFFGVTYLILMVGMKGYGSLQNICVTGQIVLVSISLSLLEATCTNGIDNLLIPFMACIYLGSIEEWGISHELLFGGLLVIVFLCCMQDRLSLLVKIQAWNLWLFGTICAGFLWGLASLSVPVLIALCKKNKRVNVFDTVWLQVICICGGFLWYARTHGIL